MLHVVKLVERRLPNQKHRIAPALQLTSTLALLIGLGLFAGAGR